FTHFNAPFLYMGKSIVTIHDMTLSYYPGRKKRSIIHRLGYHLTFRSAVHKAIKVITISENSKKDLMKLIGTREEKIQIIYQGVGEEFKPMPQNVIEESMEKLNISDPFFLYTGVWRSHKNIPNMIKAFNEIKAHPECKNLKLIMTGNENPLYPEIKETIENCNLGNEVIFTGLVPEKDLIALYNAAQMYIFPSFYEGFGLPPLEAMACGTPVAASNSSSIPEVAGEDNAVFFNPENYKEMAEKIYELYSNKALQEKLIKRGFERIKHFQWETTAKETLNLYKKCLSN
ncbi:glycosyltransferase family 4 protein, partial [Patescibacteria group bacterium]|nr:glycosyltransferase family 4 protein [Patescibacteria group bacterium]